MQSRPQHIIVEDYDKYQQRKAERTATKWAAPFMFMVGGLLLLAMENTAGGIVMILIGIAWLGGNIYPFFKK